MAIKTGIAGFMATALGALMLNTSYAASVSYVLDQSNALPDGNDYVKVTIADGLDGAIDFTVEVLSALTDLASSNFGMQAFAFNVDQGDTEASNIVVGLPPDWVASNGKQMSQFGRFDIKVNGDGNSRTNLLTFSIVGIDGDVIADYVADSSGRDSDDHVFFAAKVAGFNFVDGETGMDSAFFGGSKLDESTTVPLPSTVWLFGSAIGLLATVRRSRSAR